MADRKYWSVLTTEGKRRLAAAALSGETVGITQMAVGDGGGTLPLPDDSRTGLVNETYRASLNRLEVADTDAEVIRAEMLMPSQVGGFTLREAALFAEDGTCLAISNLPETYKPLLSEGAGRVVAVNIWIKVSNTDDVQLIIDPTIMLATVDEVKRAVAETKDHTDQSIAEARAYTDAALKEAEAYADKVKTSASHYTDSTASALDEALRGFVAQAVTQGIRDAWEQDNPVGTTRFFNLKVDPNERWPWSKWFYTGENRTLRIAAADGSNVGATGGSDNVTLQKANLPAERINVTGDISGQGEQVLRTGGGGQHRHQGGEGAPGDVWKEATHGTDNQKYATRNLTSDDGFHDHEFVIPGHGHNFSGRTDNLGSGQAFSVVEANIKLMCWSRVA
ncbi:phage tail protein [Raoultella terrigena]|uniref:phage tail protein n=1 Tax=Raoultella terrigena TaxID=577 RepID=UPI002DB9C599|nr:phage tail protein [Raoultella terrigena]MEB7598108.1 phage tail protein [Raoultella terrigena]